MTAAGSVAVAFHDNAPEVEAEMFGLNNYIMRFKHEQAYIGGFTPL